MAFGLSRKSWEVEPRRCPEEVRDACRAIGDDAPGAVGPDGWGALALGSAGGRTDAQVVEALQFAQQQHEACSRLIEDVTGRGAILYSDGSAKPPPTESRRARETTRVEAARDDPEDVPPPVSSVGRRRVCYRRCVEFHGNRERVWLRISGCFWFSLGLLGRATTRRGRQARCEGLAGVLLALG